MAAEAQQLRRRQRAAADDAPMRSRAHRPSAEVLLADCGLSQRSCAGVQLVAQVEGDRGAGARRQRSRDRRSQKAPAHGGDGSQTEDPAGQDQIPPPNVIVAAQRLIKQVLGFRQFSFGIDKGSLRIQTRVRGTNLRRMAAIGVEEAKSGRKVWVHQLLVQSPLRPTRSSQPPQASSSGHGRLVESDQHRCETLPRGLWSLPEEHGCFQPTVRPNLNLPPR